MQTGRAGDGETAINSFLRFDTLPAGSDSDAVAPARAQG